MSPFKILGLDRQADIAQIKRAYAKLLRKHRPDEDPAGFQRLHEAYEACLEQARWREQDQGWDDFEDDEGGEETEAVVATAVAAAFDFDAHGHCTEPVAFDAVRTTPDQNLSPALDELAFDEPAFDANAFIAELAQRVQDEPAETIEAWLQRHEALYSLDRKRELRPMVVHMLGELPTGAHRENHEAVIAFFGLDRIDSADEWLHRQLDDTRRRHDDAEAFERLLHKHASQHSMWTDRQLARELLGPRNWLRHGFIAATPGLPGRVAALVRELRLTDPDSAASRLDQRTIRFWERATDRGHLHWQRFAFIGARIGLWNLPISALATRRVNPLIDWLAGSTGMFVTWLAYALVVFGFLRFRDFNSRQLQWDNMTVIATGGTLFGVAVMTFYPPGGLFACIITGAIWLGARGDAKDKTDASKWPTFATALASFGLMATTMHRIIAAADSPRRFAFVIAFASLYSMAVLVLHDVFWARRKRMTLERAHLATGWLWWLFAAQAAALLAMLTVFAS